MTAPQLNVAHLRPRGGVGSKGCERGKRGTGHQKRTTQVQGRRRLAGRGTQQGLLVFGSVRMLLCDAASAAECALQGCGPELSSSTRCGGATEGDLGLNQIYGI